MTRPIVSSSTTSWKPKNQGNEGNGQAATTEKEQPKSKPKPVQPTPPSSQNAGVANELEELKRRQGALRKVPAGGASQTQSKQSPPQAPVSGPLKSPPQSGPRSPPQSGPPQQSGPPSRHQPGIPSPPVSGRTSDKTPKAGTVSQKPANNAVVRSAACPSMKRRDVADLPELRKPQPTTASPGRGVKQEKFNGVGTYVGDLSNGVRHGKGTFSWANGDEYEGSWSVDAMEGYGEYTWANGQKYAGDWIRGKPQGKGFLTWAWDLPDHQVKTGEDGIPISGGRYTGSFLAGMRNGTGIEMQPGRGTYKGEWVEDIRDGAGSFKWPNGDQFIGQWAGDKREGNGLFQWADGAKFEGVFEQDVPVEGRLTDRNGNVFQVTYAGGVPIEDSPEPATKTPAYAPHSTGQLSPSVNMSHLSRASPDMGRSIHLTPADPPLAPSPRVALYPPQPPTGMSGPSTPAGNLVVARPAVTSDVPLPPAQPSPFTIHNTSRFGSLHRQIPSVTDQPPPPPPPVALLPPSPSLSAPLPAPPDSFSGSFSSSAHVRLAYQTSAPLPPPSPLSSNLAPYSPASRQPPPPHPPVSSGTMAVASDVSPLSSSSYAPLDVQAASSREGAGERRVVESSVRPASGTVTRARPVTVTPPTTTLTTTSTSTLSSSSSFADAGIGVLLEQHRDGRMQVKTIAPGGSAARNGILQIGDQILEIDGKSMKGVLVKDTPRMVAGPEHTTVTLRIKPISGGPERTVAIIRRRMETTTTTRTAERDSAPAPSYRTAAPPPPPVSRSRTSESDERLYQAGLSVRPPPEIKQAETIRATGTSPPSESAPSSPAPLPSAPTSAGSWVAVAKPASASVQVAPRSSDSLQVLRARDDTTTVTTGTRLVSGRGVSPSSPLPVAPPRPSPLAREPRDYLEYSRLQPASASAAGPGTNLSTGPVTTRPNGTLGRQTYLTLDGTYRTFDDAPQAKTYANPGTYRTIDGTMRTFEAAPGPGLPVGSGSLGNLNAYASQPSYAEQAYSAYTASAAVERHSVMVAPTRMVQEETAYASVRSVGSTSSPHVGIGREIPAPLSHYQRTIV